MANRIQKYPIPNTCPYCNSDVIYTSNKSIYGKEFGNGKCYKCTNCDSYVGVHNGTNIPLGRMANEELRNLKKKAHALFDPTWKNGDKKRSHAYSELAKKLGIPTKECHFGWFDKKMLEKAIKLLEPSQPDQILKECADLLKENDGLTDEWGNNFIKSLQKRVNEGKNLTDKQIVYLKKQYEIIMKNNKN